MPNQKQVLILETYTHRNNGKKKQKKKIRTDFEKLRQKLLVKKNVNDEKIQLMMKSIVNIFTLTNFVRVSING